LNDFFLFFCSLFRQYSVELQENGQKIAAVEAELKASQDKIANIRKNLGARQTQLKKMETDKRGLFSKINDLKSIEYPSEHDNELLVSALPR
jgi:septation ring formation regulator EzrA